MAESLTVALLDEMIEAIEASHLPSILNLVTKAGTDHCPNDGCFIWQDCAEKLSFLSCAHQNPQEPRFLPQRDADIVDALRWATSISWRSGNLIAEQP